METPFDFDGVEVAAVSRHFGRRRALHRVSMTCARGQITTLLGPNGAGKSTLIAVLSTLLRPTAGEVRFGGAPAREIRGDRLRRSIGLLGHDLFLYGDLSAAENLEFFARVYGIADVDGVVARAIAAAGLEDRAGDRVGAFSRGLRQRLALERALLHAPRLVLLDEPFTGLDDESGDRLTARLLALRSQGAIVVMATHDFERADAVADAAVCLHAGRALPLRAGAAPLRERYRAALREVRT